MVSLAPGQTSTELAIKYVALRDYEEEHGADEVSILQPPPGATSVFTSKPAPPTRAKTPHSASTATGGNTDFTAVSLNSSVEPPAKARGVADGAAEAGGNNAVPWGASATAAANGDSKSLSPGMPPAAV